MPIPATGAPVGATPARPIATPRAAVRPSSPAIRVNYGYVVRDLRRIALTAGVLIAGLVGLSFVIR